jgi:hypothetical protein
MKKLVIQIAICFFAGLLLAACKEEDPAPVFNIPADEIAKLAPFSAAGEIQSIVLEASGNVTAASDHPDWCIPVYAYRHKQLFFDVKPNEGAARSAVVTVQSEGFPDATIPISQLGAPPTLQVTEVTNGIVLVNDNLEFTLHIVANFDEIAVELPGWISQKGANPGADGQTWSFIAQAMSANGTREADITVRASDPAVSISPVTVHVKQLKISVNIDPRPIKNVEFTAGNLVDINWEAAPPDNTCVEVEWDKQDFTKGTARVPPGDNWTECRDVVYRPSAIRYRSVVTVEGNEIAGGWQTCKLAEYNLIMIGTGTVAQWDMAAADELPFNPDEPYVYRWSGQLLWGEFRFYTHRDYTGINIGPAVDRAFGTQTMQVQIVDGGWRVKNFATGGGDVGNWDMVLDLNEMTITFTRK